MITVVSSLTGRALFTLDVDDDVVTLHPEAVHVALSSLNEAGLSDHIVIRSQPNSARIPVSHLLGGVALRGSSMTNGTGRSGFTEMEEK